MTQRSDSRAEAGPAWWCARARLAYTCLCGARSRSVRDGQAMQGHLPPPRVRVVAVGCVRRVGAHRPKHIHWLDYSVTLHVAPAARPAGSRCQVVLHSAALSATAAAYQDGRHTRLWWMWMWMQIPDYQREIADAEPFAWGGGMLGRQLAPKRQSQHEELASGRQRQEKQQDVRVQKYIDQTNYILHGRYVCRGR